MCHNHKKEAYMTGCHLTSPHLQCKCKSKSKCGMATDVRSHTQGAETHSRSQDGEPQRERGRNKQLSPHLQIPKNRSTGNLAVVAEGADDAERSSRFRFSFDAGSGAALDYDSMAR